MLIKTLFVLLYIHLVYISCSFNWHLVVAATPVARAVSVAEKHCFLCNEVISTEAQSDLKKEGLHKVKKLYERWPKVEEIFCCDNPYK